MSQYKLKKIDVINIKKEIFDNKNKKYGIKDLAERYNVSTMQITRIARGECWKDVMPKKIRNKKRINATSPKIVKKILIDIARGKLLGKEIAVKHNVTQSIVSRLKSKHAKKHTKKHAKVNQRVLKN